MGSAAHVPATHGWKRWVRYHRDVDWAMDVREACFTALPSLKIVPGHLVRYDPACAIRIRRNALPGDWMRANGFADPA